MNRKFLVGLGVTIVMVIIIYFFIRSGGPLHVRSQGETIRVVAAENFYGDIAKQLGGNYVSVTSILSDPNVDPHEYESNVQDGIAIADADIVVENGLKYDAWMDKLLSASPNPTRIVVTAGDIAPHLLPGNPHVWYGIDNMGTVARSITDALEKINPADRSAFESNFIAFNDSLASLVQKMDEIKTKYAGTPVALTETIYLYETQPMGLNVLTPFDFEKAIAEGNDPSAKSVNITNNQVENNQVKVLIYNRQTVTPVTTNLLDVARQNNIPTVAVSETMPSGATYQIWMMDELNALEQALVQRQTIKS